jgi:hypothetical protein
MSTQDVPGHGSAKSDTLAMGVWGEHNDGSLLFVESTEGGRVIYSIFDMAQAPIVEYRDAMPEKGFKETFSFGSKNSKVDNGWVFHDKTPFPWDKVMASGAKDGMRYASAKDQLNAAQRVAESMEMRGNTIDEDKWAHMLEVAGRKGKVIVDKIQRAVSALRT